jgi:septum formation protein
MNFPFQLPELILASTSPRRRDLLKRAGLDFSIVPSSVDETIVVESSPTRRVKRLSEAKAADVARQYPKSWVLGADTIVVIGEKILGKPEDPDHARRMLQRLSGRRHNVLTGYCLINRKHDRFFSEVTETEVEFKRLTEEEIEWYIQTGEPFDKAGGYAIQGRGAFLVRRVSGSVTNVIGLPLCEVIETLKECFLSDVIQDSR